MRILIVLTYYRPHVSGLTLYVQRLAEGLARRGHRVTVLASRHEADLPAEEWMEGVRVIRVPVALRVGKGPVMPSFAATLWKLARDHDVLSIHLPQLEGGLAAGLSRVAGRPAVVTYHCDLQLPAGWFNRVVDRSVFAMNYLAGAFADRIVAYTHDYAAHSRLLSRFPRKIDVIPPPVVMAPVPADERDCIRRDLGLEDCCVIGSATRVATEKGIEYLLESIPYLERALPCVQMVHAGEHRNVMGEEDYLRRLEPLIERYRAHVTFLGQLPPERMRAFFSSIDVLVVSSVNATESFGLVQVEAMLCGTPVVATDLPGVREPIRMTGMGEVVPPRDPRALAEAVLQIIRHRDRYIRPREEIAALFDLEETLTAYETLLGMNCAAVRAR